MQGNYECYKCEYWDVGHGEVGEPRCKDPTGTLLTVTCTSWQYCIVSSFAQLLSCSGVTYPPYFQLIKAKYSKHCFRHGNIQAECGGMRLNSLHL